MIITCRRRGEDTAPDFLLVPAQRDRTVTFCKAPLELCLGREKLQQCGAITVPRLCELPAGLCAEALTLLTVLQRVWVCSQRLESSDVEENGQSILGLEMWKQAGYHIGAGIKWSPQASNGRVHDQNTRSKCRPCVM